MTLLKIPKHKEYKCDVCGKIVDYYDKVYTFASDKRIRAPRHTEHEELHMCSYCADRFFGLIREENAEKLKVKNEKEMAKLKKQEKICEKCKVDTKKDRDCYMADEYGEECANEVDLSWYNFYYDIEEEEIKDCKQIPLKLVETYNHERGCCSTCNTYIQQTKDEYLNDIVCCPYCGQEIDWEDK